MKAAALAMLLAGSLNVPSAAFGQTSTTPPTPAPAAPTAPSPDPAPTPAAPTQPPPAATSPAPATAAPGSAAQPATPTRQMNVSELTEKDLVGANNDEVGDIERVVESNADKKQYVVIGQGGFLGLFETEVLIPIENVAIKGDQIVLRNLSQEQLKSLPKYESEDTAYRRLEDNQSVALAEER
ncbi:MAG TPA: PRC-barrel domain-containing protein [Microvirga sp.]|nr:PRC-barrel domain-containing protein [Microvirga sp.]